MIADTWRAAADLVDPPAVDPHPYIDRPVDWVRDKLGERPWSKQRDILRSVYDNRRTAVHSCHTIGKSWVAARVAAWWIETHPPGEAFMVSMAPTAGQVRAVLWRELRRAHAKGRLRGRTNQTEWLLRPPGLEEELVAFGRSPDDYDPDALQGIHAPYVLVIIDEASGVAETLWTPADSLISSEGSRILAIGNPYDPGSKFARVCEPGSGWNTIGIGYNDTPNFTGEQVDGDLAAELINPTWVEERRHELGEDSPLYIAGVLGQFPETRDGGLIPLQAIRNALERRLEPGEPRVIGADVGGGGDRNVNVYRAGPVARVVRRDQIADTMVTHGNLIADMRTYGAERANIDAIGIGKGASDRARELGEAVTGINVGTAARDPETFANLRAEGYWGLRERFIDGEIDINDEALAAQLAALRYARTSTGKIQIERKDQMRKRLSGRSPDEADALMLAFLPPGEPKSRKVRLTW